MGKESVPVRGEPQVRRGTPGCGRTQRRQRLTGEWAEAVQQDQPFPSRANHKVRLVCGGGSRET